MNMEGESNTNTKSVVPKQPNVAIEDCLSCKVIGMSTFTGIGLYALHLRMKTPVADKRQRVFLACFAVSAFGVASLRMFV